MDGHATGTFAELSWEETTDDEHAGGRLAHAVVTTRYRGDLEGDGAVTYVMSYLADGPVTFAGYERVTGRLHDRQGSFVLFHQGVFQDTTARIELAVVEGSATDELAGLRGTGWLEADTDASTHPFELDWQVVPAPATVP